LLRLITLLSSLLPTIKRVGAFTFCWDCRSAKSGLPLRETIAATISGLCAAAVNAAAAPVLAPNIPIIKLF
jgi:hypothetical protein